MRLIKRLSVCDCSAVPIIRVNTPASPDLAIRCTECGSEEPVASKTNTMFAPPSEASPAEDDGHTCHARPPSDGAPDSGWSDEPPF